MTSRIIDAVKAAVNLDFMLFIISAPFIFEFDNRFHFQYNIIPLLSRLSSVVLPLHIKKCCGNVFLRSPQHFIISDFH